MYNSYILQQKELIQQLKAELQQGQLNLSIVEMQKDYENDEAISLTSVSFLSAEIAELIIKSIIKPLQRIEPDHFYYDPTSLHLTIKNVRKMHNPPLFTEKDVAKVQQLFEKKIQNFPSFIFNFEGLVIFPTSVALIGYCNDTLKQLIQTLDNGLKEIGLSDDKKYISDTIFFGNITLCRLTHNPSLLFQNKLKELENIYIGEMPINEVNLVTCNAVCHPKTRKIIDTYYLSS